MKFNPTQNFHIYSSGEIQQLENTVQGINLNDCLTYQGSETCNKYWIDWIKCLTSKPDLSISTCKYQLLTFNFTQF